MRIRRASSSTPSSGYSVLSIGVAIVLGGGLVLVCVIGFSSSSSPNDYATNLLLSLENLGQSAASPVAAERQLCSSSAPESPGSSSPGYSLAYEQSFGFFDDISDQHWKIAQQIHQQGFPNYYIDTERHSHGMLLPRRNDPKRNQVLGQTKDWYAENFQVEFHCPLARRMPSNSDGDGPKWVCDPHRLAKKKDCLIYSIGCNGKVQFEKGIRDNEATKHCEIHTFDLKGQNRRFGNFTERLQGYSTFHHVGLGTSEQAANNPAQYQTLPQLMKRLGHEGRRIDIFKIDCEWCEWSTYTQWIPGAENGKEGSPTTPDLMKQNPPNRDATITPAWMDIRQILVETHNAPMPNSRNFFLQLHDAGYVIFSKEANYQSSASGVEFAFVKLSRDFFVNGTTYQAHMEQNGGNHARMSGW